MLTVSQKVNITFLMSHCNFVLACCQHFFPFLRISVSKLLLSNTINYSYPTSFVRYMNKLLAPMLSPCYHHGKLFRGLPLPPSHNCDALSIGNILNLSIFKIHCFQINHYIFYHNRKCACFNKCFFTLSMYTSLLSILLP